MPQVSDVSWLVTGMMFLVLLIFFMVHFHYESFVSVFTTKNKIYFFFYVLLV